MARINGTDGNDYLSGTAGDDAIYLRGGDDTGNGGAGNDYISGDGGNDLLNGEDGADRLYGGIGNDNIGGGWGDDRLYGDSGNDVLSDHLGNNVLTGGLGDDNISGNGKLLGGAGNDALDMSNPGFDNVGSMTGGTGADTFYATMFSLADGDGQRHITITDFNAAEGDKLHLNGFTGQGGDNEGWYGDSPTLAFDYFDDNNDGQISAADTFVDSADKGHGIQLLGWDGLASLELDGVKALAVDFLI